MGVYQKAGHHSCTCMLLTRIFIATGYAKFHPSTIKMTANGEMQAFCTHPPSQPFPRVRWTHHHQGVACGRSIEPLICRRRPYTALQHRREPRSVHRHRPLVSAAAAPHRKAVIHPRAISKDGQEMFPCSSLSKQFLMQCNTHKDHE